MFGSALLFTVAVPGVAMAMSISSTDFANNGAIPPVHTCEAADRAPSLTFAGVPDGARSLALIVDDPDAPDPAHPKMTWVHQVVYNLPATATGIPPAAGKDGVNDWKQPGWRGPCPPVGRHRYFFKLYALDTTLDLGRPTKAALEKAMKGHVIAEAQLVGTYEKKSKK